MNLEAFYSFLPLLVPLLIINVYGLLLMGMDKRRAIRKRRRISERTLMTVACLFGSIGIYLGLRLFRHKTKHPKFYIGVPILFALQLVLTLAVVQWTIP